EGPRPGLTLVVDYEKTRDVPAAGLEMIVRTPDGQTGTVVFRRPLTDRTGVIRVSSGFGPFNQLPRDAEVYLKLTDGRYPGRPTFKVSNTVTYGTVTGATLARNWTADEANTLRQPPPKPKTYEV